MMKPEYWLVCNEAYSLENTDGDTGHKVFQLLSSDPDGVAEEAHRVAFDNHEYGGTVVQIISTLDVNALREMRNAKEAEEKRIQAEKERVAAEVARGSMFLRPVTSAFRENDQVTLGEGRAFRATMVGGKLRWVEQK